MTRIDSGILAELGDDFTVRKIPCTDAYFSAALHKALGWSAPTARETAETRTGEFVADCRQRGLSYDLLFAAVRGCDLLGACLGMESPGRAVLLLFPTEYESPAQRHATAATVTAVRNEAWSKSNLLQQALVPPNSCPASQLLRSAGFRPLTRLVYLERSARGLNPVVTCAAELEWVSYSPVVEPLFLAAIEASYAQSSDCPELTDLRPTTDVLAGHRAAGEFDPQLWWVAQRSGQPVGVVLLAGLSQQRAVEIAYMGVAPTARGTGVADALLRRAIGAADRSGARAVTLAVDRRNERALHVYRRWGFSVYAERDAWIATNGGADSYA